jgi:hypothetical protein
MLLAACLLSLASAGASEPSVTVTQSSDPNLNWCLAKNARPRCSVNENQIIRFQYASNASAFFILEPDQFDRAVSLFKGQDDHFVRNRSAILLSLFSRLGYRPAQTAIGTKNNSRLLSFSISREEDLVLIPVCGSTLFWEGHLFFSVENSSDLELPICP